MLFAMALGGIGRARKAAAGGGGGTPPVRQSFTESSPAVSETSTATTVNSVAIGEMLLVCVRWYGTQTITSITCTGESNLTAVGAVHTGGPNSGRNQWYVLESATASGNKTLTCTWSASVNPGTFVVWRLSSQTGIDGTLGSASVGASGSGTTPSASVTTSVDSCAVFWCGIASDSDITCAGYTSETMANSFWFDCGGYDLDAGAAGSKAATGGGNDSGWVLSVCAVKPA